MSTLFQIALTRIPRVGPVTAKNLISYCGGPEAVFREKKSALVRIPGVGNEIANQVRNAHRVFREAEGILQTCKKHGIRILFYLSADFPKRLHHIPDSPLVLYARGKMDLNHPRMIAMVGTRSPTAFGRDTTERIVRELAQYGILVVSGLAYGIDIAAHQYCLWHGVPTVAVLGSGIGRIYPHVHRHAAEKMITEGGGVLSEFDFNAGPDRENFPMRNRLIAGLSDAVVVIESARKGGSMITASIANGYNRDVFAIPGRPSDRMSRGCNALISDHKAHLAETGDDIALLLGWKDPGEQAAVQRQIFVELDENEKLVAELIKSRREIEIDALTPLSKMQTTKLATVLLSLEFKGLIKSLPGKKYRFLQ